MNDGEIGDEGRELDGARRSGEDFGFCSERPRKPLGGAIRVTLAAAAWEQQ